MTCTQWTQLRSESACMNDCSDKRDCCLNDGSELCTDPYNQCLDLCTGAGGGGGGTSVKETAHLRTSSELQTETKDASSWRVAGAADMPGMKHAVSAKM